MHGTLEVKQEGLTVDAVKRPDWMDDVAVDAMTEDQRKVITAPFNISIISIPRDGKIQSLGGNHSGNVCSGALAHSFTRPKASSLGGRLGHSTISRDCGDHQPGKKAASDVASHSFPLLALSPPLI